MISHRLAPAPLSSNRDYRQSRMGFLAPIDACNVPDGHPTGRSPIKTSSNDTLFAFDSGRCFTFAEGVRSTLVLGGTGSGKTTSVILPMLEALLRRGFGGVILDVKGNLGAQTRELAKSCGRLNDVVEFGSSPDACATNLLADMKQHEIADFFQVLAVHGMERDSNISWYAKGGSLAADVAQVLSSLAQVERNCHFSRQFTPTLKAVFAALSNHTFAANLWKFYCQELGALRARSQHAQKPDCLMEAEAFYHAVNAECFHVLLTEDIGASNKDAVTNKQQKTWMLQGILGRFKAIQATHDLMDRFSSLADDAVPLDFTDLVYRQKKVVLVHFSPDCGPTGALLSRCIKERFYQSILKNGSKLSSDQYTFMIGDEFQHILDVDSERPLNDMELFGLSREFRNINIIASQSMASLYAKGGTHAVSSLLGNCMTKIMLQNGDPETLDWVAKVRDDGADMKGLGRGECLLESIDQEGRCVSTKESVNTSHDAVSLHVLAAQKLIMDKPSRPRREKPQMPVGNSGLPQCVEQCLLKTPKSLTGARMMWIALVAMRQESCQGLPYWKREPKCRKFEPQRNNRDVF